MNGEKTQFIEPPPDYSGYNQFMNWHGYSVEVGGGYGPHLLNELQKRLTNIESCIVSITGSGGSGKTYFCLRLAEILDPRFDVQTQVCFTAEDFMRLIGPKSPLKMKQCIIVDESQFSMSNRTWFEANQRDLMNAFASLRFRGFCIFVVALSESMLDVIARKYLFAVKCHMLGRGHARSYKTINRPLNLPPLFPTLSRDTHLELPNAEYCENDTCLTCYFSGLSPRRWARRSSWDKTHFPACQNLRAIYERRKKEFLEKMAQKSLDKTTGKEPDNESITEEEVFTLCLQNPHRLIKSTKNRIQYFSVVSLVKEKYGEKANAISERFCIRVSRRLDRVTGFSNQVPQLHN